MSYSSWFIRITLGLTALAGISLLFACNQSKEKKYEVANNSKPNVILIMVDDLSKEWVSCYGAEDINTPNIDALAKSGTMFHNVYSMPQCTPTRVSLLTGQYPFRHGWVNHWDVPRWGGGAHFDETMNPSLGIEMQNAGYKTCIAGKWQIDDFRVEPEALTKNGFDEYCMWTGYETGVAASGNRYQNPYIFTKKGSKTYEGEFGPDIFRDFIINFIHTYKDTSMFIYYPMVLTHTPFINTPDDSSDTVLGKHKAMVKYTDKITGEIVQALEDAKIRDNTLVLWTTDNGTTSRIEANYKGRRLKGGKSRITESGICAPFIVSWPNHVESNHESQALIDFTDLFPTCLDIAGVTPQGELVKGNKKYVIDGKSIKDVLLNTSQESHREWILGMGGGNNARLTENGVENQYIFRNRVLRNKKYKLYIDSNRKPEKFFDLLIDTFEENNIIDSLRTLERKKNFDKLMETIKLFPVKDSEPKYYPNPPQIWDVKITAQSQEWKL